MKIRSSDQRRYRCTFLWFSLGWLGRHSSKNWWKGHQIDYQADHRKKKFTLDYQSLKLWELGSNIKPPDSRTCLQDNLEKSLVSYIRLYRSRWPHTHRIYHDYKKEFFPGLLHNPHVTPEDKRKISELLKKPWNPYIRRHSALTQKSRILKEYTLRQFGVAFLKQIGQVFSHVGQVLVRIGNLLKHVFKKSLTLREIDW
jgi:hypothetical protein